MHTYAVYFRPVSRLATWPLSSDMLAGAVCWGVRLLGLMSDAELTEWLESQVNAPRFAFSHAFPAYFGRSSAIRFYPRPATFQPASSDFETAAQKLAQNGQLTLKYARIQLVSQAKKLKKFRYVTEATLQRILSGECTVQELIADAQKSDSQRFRCEAYCSPQEGTALGEMEKLVEALPIQHNQVDRVAGATVEGALFFKSEISFAPEAGLWALLRAHPADYDRYLLPALRFLGDSGLGADRTTGSGFFQISAEPYTPFEVAAQTRAALCLSHYLPAADELDLDGNPISYSLVTLRPKRERRYPLAETPAGESLPVYKQSIRVFAPGSVLPLKSQKEVYGRWARLTPAEDEPVYQSGAALMLPL